MIRGDCIFLVLQPYATLSSTVCVARCSRQHHVVPTNGRSAMDRMTPDVPEVLIVENDDDIGLGLRDRYQSLGCQVHVARTGAAAIAIAATHDFHAVILDLSLPDMDGVEVLGFLKEIDPTLSTVVLASELDTQVRKEVIALGVFGYLVKPCNGHELDAFLSWAVKVKMLSIHKNQDASVGLLTRSS